MSPDPADPPQSAGHPADASGGSGARWRLRFVTDEVRAREMVSLYRELGFETAIEPAGASDVRPDCGECPIVRLRLLRRVSTRWPGNAAGGEER